MISDYKGLALPTKLPTPSGWTTMEKVSVGDELFGGDGYPCTVVAKSDVHHNPCYEILFDDDSTIVCDHEHYWEVTGEFDTRLYRTEYLRKIIESSDWYIPISFLNLPDTDLLMDPYQIGVLLGDSYSIYLEPEKRWFTGVWGKKGRRIPPECLRASYLQRVMLLSGILSRHPEEDRMPDIKLPTNGDEEYAKDLDELLSSIGVKFKIVKSSDSNNVEYVFRPESTHAKSSSFVDKNLSMRKIISITPVETVPTQCIAVDSPDNTYLCGERMIKTHNTGRSSIKKKDVPTNLQTAIYTIAAKEMWPAKQYITELIYPRLMKTVRHEFTNEQLEEIKEHIRELTLYAKMSQRFPPKGGPVNCGFCGFSDKCKWGARQAKIWQAIVRKRNKNKK